MNPLLAIVVAGMLCTGCTSMALSPEPAEILLDQADAKLAAADYSGAQASYAEFVNANPGNPQAARARAIQAALDRLLSTQTELDRVNRNEDVLHLRREIAERRGDVERLKAENAKLRTDLERLMDIDLQTLPGAKK
jgi:hypothetical protein